MANETQRVNMVSTGQLLSGLSADRVAERLNRQFGISERQAQAMLKKGTVLKKSIKVEDAKKVTLLFARLGLKVVAQTAGHGPVPGRDNHSRPAATAQAESGGHQPDPNKGEAAQWLNGNIDPPAVPFYLANPCLLMLAGAVPGLLAPAVYLGLILWLAFGLLGSVWALWAPGATWGLPARLGLGLLATVQFVLLFFLLKPIIARRAGWSGSRLSQAEGPILFSLVEALCERMGIPCPTRILVNNAVRAEVRPAGASGLLHGDFQLTLGLPLAASMNPRQLAGVLAQQLGYCVSPATLATCSLIQGVNAWLARRAFSDDPWDKCLDNMCQRGRYRLLRTLARWVRQGTVYTRLLLWGLLRLNHQLTRFAARRLDANADYYEAVVCGSDSFTANSKVLVALAAARQRVREMNARAWNQHKLLADVPAAIRQVLDQMDEKSRTALLAEEAPFPFQMPGFQTTCPQRPNSGESTGRNTALESVAALNIGAHAHPDDSRRMNKAEALACVGLWCDNSDNNRDSSAHLFENFEALGAQVTLEEYQSGGIRAFAQGGVLRDQGINPERYVVDNSRILALNEAVENARHALFDYLGSSYDERIMEFDEPRNAELLRMNLQQNIDWIRGRLMGYREDQERLKKALADLQHRYLGQSYVAAGIAVDCRHFGFVSTHRACIDDALKNAREVVKKLTGQLHQVDRMFFQRITLAIYQMESREKNIAKRYLSALQAMGAFQVSLQQLRVSRYVIAALSDKQPEPWRLESDWVGKVLPQLKAQAKACARLLLKIVEESQAIGDCNDDGEEQTLRDVIFSRTGKITPAVGELSPLAVAEVAAQVEAALHAHYGYRLGQLAEMCGKTELRLGVGPLKLYQAQKQN